MAQSIHTAVIMAGGEGRLPGNDIENCTENGVKNGTANGTENGADNRAEQEYTSFLELNGKPIIIQSIETLISCGIERIIVATSNQKAVFESLREEYPEVICCSIARHVHSGSLYALWSCRHLIGSDDFLLLDSNLIYEPKAVTKLIECKYPSAVWATTRQATKEIIGIYKLSNKLFRAICREIESAVKRDGHDIDESVLSIASKTRYPIHYLDTKNLFCCRIESEDDIQKAGAIIQFEHKRHTYHSGVKNIRHAPLVCYRNSRYFGHGERMNKEDAAYLLNTLKKVFEANGIELILAYGTLLGAIREHDFIGHDNDMDTMIYSKHMQRGLDLEPELAKYGIKLECYVLPWIFTYSYKGVTCDIDIINEPVYPLSKRYCLIQAQYVKRSLFEHTKEYEFKGERHIVPANPEAVLEYHYGKNWRIPSSKHARIQSKLFFGYYISKHLRRLKRYLMRKFNKQQILFRSNSVANLLTLMQNEDEFTISQFIQKIQKDRPKEWYNWKSQVSSGDNAEAVIEEQLFKFLYESNGKLGVVLAEADSYKGDNCNDIAWHWVKG